MAISLGPIRKAGQVFGIDLESLFTDEENKSLEGFEGFSPTVKVVEQHQGRSPSTLTYMAPKTPPKTVTFELAPKTSSAIDTSTTTPAATTPAATTPATVSQPAALPTQTETTYEEPAVEEKAQRLLSSFIGPLGTAGSIGAEGIGRAQEYGYSPEQIKSMAQAEGLTFGDQAAQQLGVRTLAQTYAAPQTTAAPSAPAATATTPKPTASSPISAFATSPSSGAIGLAGLQRAAEAKGITVQQAANRAINQGLTLGAAAAKKYK